MKAVRGGSEASISSIQASKFAVSALSNCVRLRFASDADVRGVATAEPTSKSRDCTSSSCTSTQPVSCQLSSQDHA